MPAKRPDHHVWATAIGAILTERRKSLGLSQNDVAADAGIDRSAYAYYEQAKHLPSWPVSSRLAEALEWDLSELIAEVESRMHADEEARGAA